jgi:hypothetical protein
VTLRRTRTIGAGALVVLSCLLVLFASLAVWINRTVVSTDGWVDTVGPLSREDAVAFALSDALVTKIGETVDLESYAEEQLPGRAQALAAPLAGAVRTFVRDQLQNLILSDQFNEIWESANERAHDLFVRFMNDELTAAERAEGIVINLQDAVTELDSRLEDRGLDLFENEIPDDLGSVQLFGEGRVETARTAWDALDALDWVLVAVALVVIAAAVLISNRRRRTGIQIGVGIVLTMALFAVGVRFARNLLFGDIEREEIRAAADAIWDHVRAGLLQQTVVLFVLGILVAFGLWVTSPGRSASRVRAFWGRQLTGLRAETMGDRALPGAGSFLRDHRRAVEGALLALTLLVLLLVPRLSVAILLVAAVVLVALVAAVEFLAGSPRPEAPAERSPV